ncbi:MAG: hypothetical protein QOD29_840, partial [Alphaproteobacteria bacterium]|nr:hypothetical protein [Alphaproteobacteria bacterium]
FLWRGKAGVNRTRPMDDKSFFLDDRPLFSATARRVWCLRRRATDGTAFLV